MSFIPIIRVACFITIAALTIITIFCVVKVILQDSQNLRKIKIDLSTLIGDQNSLLGIKFDDKFKNKHLVKRVFRTDTIHLFGTFMYVDRNWFIMILENNVVIYNRAYIKSIDNSLFLKLEVTNIHNDVSVIEVNDVGNESNLLSMFRNWFYEDDFMDWWQKIESNDNIKTNTIKV